jgi:plastocyanin
MVKAILALALLFPATQEPQTFTVSGIVKLDGPVPKARLNKALMGDPACANCHPEDPPKDDLVVDASGRVKWAFVYVKKGLEGKEFKSPTEAVLVDQVGCMYNPRVTGVMVGQTLNYRNSDPMLHNVKGLPFANREWNFGQAQGTVTGVKLTHPEVMVKVVCNVHPFMASYVGVLDHPFFAVSGGDGKFEIKNLPPGTYTLGVWHEGLETTDKTNEVVVQVKAAAQVDLLLKKK